MHWCFRITIIQTSWTYFSVHIEWEHGFYSVCKCGMDCNILGSWKIYDINSEVISFLSFNMHFLSWEGNKAAKVVFVDSPLLKKEMTIRERNQIFHEIPVDFLATKKSYVSISDVLMDKPDEDNLFQWDVCSFISFLEGGGIPCFK